MRAAFTVAPASHTHFLEARRGYRGFLMPAYVREQMLHELVTVETLTTLARWILDSGKTREWVDIGKGADSRLRQREQRLVARLPARARRVGSRAYGPRSGWSCVGEISSRRERLCDDHASGG
jgi:hypothetical protein